MTFRAHNAPPKLYARPGAEVRQLHPHGRTNDYLRCLAAGAAIVDPGDLDTTTEETLTQMTRAGELQCEHNHGRRLWRRA